MCVQITTALQRSPVLLLPTHRSYMDFLIISYLFFFARVPVPSIAGQKAYLSGPVPAIAGQPDCVLHCSSDGLPERP